MIPSALLVFPWYPLPPFAVLSCPLLSCATLCFTPLLLAALHSSLLFLAILCSPLLLSVIFHILFAVLIVPCYHKFSPFSTLLCSCFLFLSHVIIFYCSPLFFLLCFLSFDLFLDPMLSSSALHYYPLMYILWSCLLCYITFCSILLSLLSSNLLSPRLSFLA
jgi:hypothetical protein